MPGKNLAAVLAVLALALVATTSASGLSAPEVIRVLNHEDTECSRGRPSEGR